MRRFRTLRLIVSGCLFTGLVVGDAAGTDLPVSYTIDEKSFVKGTRSGSVLVFTLYADAGCTTEIHRQTATAESIALIERVRRLRPRGATPRRRPPDSITC